MLIRKFYDPAIAEPAATPAPSTSRFELVNESISLEDVFQGMAEQDKPPAEIETKETPTIETKETEKVESNVVETIATEKTEIPTHQTPTDWRELIQKEDPKEVYKFLNIDESLLSLAKDLETDEFLKKAVIYRKENGNLTPFIEAATKDWDKISPENLILDDLKKQYSHLSSDKAEKLAKADFNSRFVYKDDPDLTEAENQEMADLMALKLESEVEKTRSTRKAEQKAYLDSVKPVDRSAEQQKAIALQAEQDQREFELWKNSIESNPITQKLASEKKIVLGEKEKAFNYTVNPDSIKEKTLNTNKFYEQFWDSANGKNVFNVDKWNRVAAYAENPSAFEDSLINHGISLGKGEVVEKELVNESPRNNQQVQTTKKSLAKTFAEEGQSITLEQLYGG